MSINFASSSEYKSESKGFFSSSKTKQEKQTSQNIASLLQANNVNIETGNLTLIASKIKANEAQITAEIINLISSKDTDFFSQNTNRSGILTRTMIDEGKITEILKEAKIEVSDKLIVNGEDITTQLSTDNIIKTLSSQSNLSIEQINLIKATLNNKEWNDKTTTLSGIGALIVAIVVTVLTAGAGTALVGAATTATVQAAVVQSIVTGVTTQLATSVITGNSFKLDAQSLVKGAVSAGVMSYASSMIDSSLNLENVKVADMDYSQQFQQGVSNTVVKSAVDSAVYGTDFGDSLKTNLGNTLQATLSSNIGDSYFNGDTNYLEHKGLHALSGAIGSAIAGNDIASGALGAVTGEVIGEAVGTDLIKDGDFSKSDEKIVKLSSSLGTIFTAEALGKDAQTAYNSSDIAVDNNTIYLLKNKVVAIDKDKNDKVIVLSEEDKEKLLKEDTTTTLVELSNTINSYLSAGETYEVIPTISKYAQYNVTNSEIYNLNNQEDLNFLIKETDMGYINNDENTRVYFANGMDNTAPQALQTAKNIESLVNKPVGSIINSTDGIAGDVEEYLQGYSTKDVLNEYTYRKLNNNTPSGEKTTVIMHSAGNTDTAKAIDLGRKQGYSYPNLQFVSAGSPSSEEYLRSIFNSAGSTLVGQVNDWKDPVTHSKTVGSAVIGVGLLGGYLGAKYMPSIIPASQALTGTELGQFLIGVGSAGVGAGVGAGGILLYHNMDKYLEKPELQNMIRNSVLKEK